MRNVHILFFLALIPFSLPAETPGAPVPAEHAAPAVEGAAFVRLESANPTALKHPKIMFAGFTLDIAARTLDAYSTHRALQLKGNREMILPNAIAKSQPALYAYSASVVLSQCLGYRFLVAHHHQKIARWLPYIDSVSVLPFAAHNLRLIHDVSAAGNNSPGAIVQGR